MKNKGFSLIELLAVLVVLSILALIVSPKIGEVIKDFKINSAARSMEGFVAGANTAISVYISDNYGKIPESYKDIVTLVEAKNKSKVKNPKVTIDDDGIVTTIYAQIDNYYCMYKDKEGAKCSEEKIGLYPGKVVYFNPVSGQVCNNYVKANSASGVKEGCMLFYVVNDNGNTVDLILDHNTSSGIQWVSEKDYGLLAEAKGLNKQEAIARYNATPVVSNGYTYIAGLNDLGPKTALDQLKIDTQEWSGMPTRTDNYTLIQNVSGVTTNYTVNYDGSKARLITAQEIADITGATKKSNWNETTSVQKDWYYLDSLNHTQTAGTGKSKTTSDYAWLFNNLKGCQAYGCTMANGITSGDSGYWTSTAVAGFSNGVWSMFYNGNVSNGNVSRVLRGIRPVITIPSNILK